MCLQALVWLEVFVRVQIFLTWEVERDAGESLEAASWIVFPRGLRGDTFPCVLTKYINSDLLTQFVLGL